MEKKYELLPPRSKNTQGSKFQNAQQETFLSNYYEVRLASKNAMIYQYSLQTEPPLPKDSTKLLALVTKSIKKDLKEKIGYATASGNMIWGHKQIKIASIHQAEFIQDGTEYKFEVMVKPAKEFSLLDVAEKEEYLMMAKQLFNNKLKEKLRLLGMVDLGGGKYYTGKETEDSDFDIKQAGLKVIRGFKFTLSSIKGINVLNIDVCSRVFRSESFLQSISNMNKDQIMQTCPGSIVITRYGKRKTYKIEEVDFKQSPSSQFFSNKAQGKITYAAYYNESYGIKIRDMKQPLVKVILQTDKKMEKGKLVEIPTYGYLIPELISLTGMSDEQKANHNTMRALAPSTKLTPKERLEATENFKKKLNEGEEIVGNPRKVTGFSMFEPEIFIGPGKLRMQGGNLNLKDELKETIHFKDWLFVYSRGKNQKYDDQDADDAVRFMKKAAETFRIRIQNPGYLTVDGRNVREWIELISSDIQKNGKPQIIVFFVQRQQENYYGVLKELLSIKFNVPCQFIRRRTLSQQSKNPLSAASKIVIQMNAKAGGAPWLVGKSHDYFKGKKIIYGGISISKGKGGFTVAFVGSISDDFSKVFSFCKTGIKNKDIIDQALFQKFFTQWARNYVMKNGAGPQIVMIYRQGLSIPQIRLQLHQQVEALQNTMKKIATKTKNPKYNPQVVYMVCNKKINTRFYAMNGGQGAQQSGGKFRPDISNPSPGSCVMQELSVQNVYDFHLVAQLVTQGTATPTQYIVAYDSSNIPQDALARFTYDMCYNYYNWSGSVKVPACLQCANKLSKLVGEGIGKDVIEGEITKTLYFL